LREHGFSDEDAWDIGAIAAFFGLSNRMANLISLRPNDEFHLLGRLPREEKPT
jgi:alkylhydroperoxidase family enzyme